MPATWRRGAFGLAVAAGLAALTAMPAGAADLAKQWEVGAYAVESVYDNDSLISDTLSWGVRGGYHFTPAHAVELTYELQTPDEATKPSRGATFDLTKVVVNYVHDLKSKKPDSKIGIFALFGVGQMRYELSDRDDRETTSILQTGGGVRVAMTKRIAIRLDGKLWHFHGDGDLVPRHGYFAFDFDAGVSFYFGPGS